MGLCCLAFPAVLQVINQAAVQLLTVNSGMAAATELLRFMQAVHMCCLHRQRILPLAQQHRMSCTVQGARAVVLAQVHYWALYFSCKHCKEHTLDVSHSASPMISELLVHWI